MGFAENLYRTVALIAETITFGTSETLLSILAGALISYFSLKLILFIDQKRARALLKSSEQKRSGYDGNVDVEFMTDIVDEAVWDPFDFGLLYIMVSMLGCLLCAAFLNASGMIAFSVSHLACSLCLPVWEMRKRTIRLIDETICETENTMVVDKKLSREFYKKLVNQYKPGRKWAEFFTYTNYILERNLEYIRTTT